MSYGERLRDLRAHLASFDRLAIAFSGGVDSSVLLHAAHRALGDRAVGLIADSPSLPRLELADALAFADAHGIALTTLHTNELEVEGYRRNAGERCYWCRKTLFEGMAAWALAHGFAALAYGEISDDLLDHRPGRRAAHELGVVAPLSAAGFAKADVRRYAREHGLSAADKPASACLSSRIPTGTEVTPARLQRVEEAEERVRALGFRQLRVRDHGRKARVELAPEELARGASLRDRLAGTLAELSFEEVELVAYRRPGAVVT